MNVDDLFAMMPVAVREMRDILQRHYLGQTTEEQYFEECKNWKHKESYREAKKTVQEIKHGEG